MYYSIPEKEAKPTKNSPSTPSGKIKRGVFNPKSSGFHPLHPPIIRL
jgi:hypothetical protein